MNRTKHITARRHGQIQVESLEGRQLLVAGPTVQATATAQNLLSRQRGFVLERVITPTRPVATSPSGPMGPRPERNNRFPVWTAPT